MNTQHRTYIKRLLKLLLGFLLCNSVTASNLWREQEISADILSIVDKQHVVWLDSGQREPFLGLYKASRQIKTRGGILLLHDFGHHPNWPDVIAPLRQSLADDGWHTLSLQGPIPDPMWHFSSPQDIYDESVARLEAGIKYLKDKNITDLAIISQGEMAALVSQYLSQNKDVFKAFVAISISHNKQVQDWRNSLNSMKSLHMPVLDIYAEFDSDTVLENASERLVAARLSGTQIQQPPPIPHSAKVRELAKKKTNNLWYRQIQIQGAHSGFAQSNDRFLRDIRGWLRHYTKRQNRKTTSAEDQPPKP